MTTEPMDNSTVKACAEYEVSLEDYLAGELGGAEARRVAEHVKSCHGCRAALDQAAASTRFLRTAMPLMDRAVDPGPGFAHLVMARIRTESILRDQKSIWRPVAMFAWRFAMSASLALALLIAYASRRPDQTSSDVAQVRSGDLFSDPAGPPASRDDVLRIMAETNHGN